MAGRDILGSLLFGLGSGLSTYGKLKGEQVALTEEEKAKQRQKKADADMKAEQEQRENEIAARRQVDFLATIDPELAERIHMTQWKSRLGGTPVAPLEDKQVEMLRGSMQSQKAQSLLDQIGGQGAVNQVTGATGEDSGYATQTMREQSFNQSGPGPMPVERIIGDSIQKIRAIQTDKALNAAALKARTAKEYPTKDDPGSVLNQQETFDRFQRHVASLTAAYNTERRLYEGEMDEWDREQAKAATDPTFFAKKPKPSPPAYPPLLKSYLADPETAFLAWAGQQANVLGELGGRVEGLPKKGPKERGAGAQRDATQTKSVTVPDSIKSKSAYKKLKARGWSDERIMEELSK